jgi:transcriptional regulator
LHREQVLRLREAGRTFAEIGAEIGVTTRAAWSIAKRLNLPRPPRRKRRDEAKYQKVRELRESGMTYRKIGAALGMTRQRAQQIFVIKE